MKQLKASEVRYIVEGLGLTEALLTVATTEIEDPELASYWNKAQIVHSRILEILFPEDNIVMEADSDE